MNGPNLAKMAWRNLWKNRRRTLITLLSISFGGFMAVMMTALQDRSFSDFIDTAARNGGGHVTLAHPEYIKKHSLLNTVGGTDALLSMATADLGVQTAVPRIGGQIMLSTARGSRGTAFIAVDPQRETDETFTFWDGLVEGKAFVSADDRGIVMGEKLARKLGISLGKKVVYTLVDNAGEVVAHMDRLTGIIRTGVPSLDAGLCLIPINRARKLLGYDRQESSQIALFVEDSRDSEEVARRLGRGLPDGVVALTWDEAQPQLASFIAMKIGGGRVFQILITLLVSAGIFNTLFVSVMERLREFGVLMAIGFSPAILFRLVMWESFLLGLCGLGLGGLLTAGPYFYLAKNGIDASGVMGGSTTEIAGVGFDAVMRVGIYPESLAFIALAVVAATVLAGVYPAMRAGRVNPADTIRLV